MAKKMYLTEDKSLGVKVLEAVTQIAVILVLGLFLAQFFFFSTKNESRSMEPTVKPGAIIFTDRLAYAFTGPKRFDVVSFRRNGKSEEVLTRRVIGLPGETVRISRGKVYIDDVELDVSMYLSEITSDGLAEDGFKLRQDEFFVIGDMPANSEDSRMSTVGAVSRRLILGRAWLSAESITDLHFIH